MTSDLEHLFTNTEPVVWDLYNDLLKEVQQFGDMTVEPKKTSIHWVNKSAFLGLHPLKTALDLTIVSEEPIDSERIKKHEQASKSRYHNETRLTQESDIDPELLAWIKMSYLLRG